MGFGEGTAEADALLREDEARFIDLERSVVFFTEEHEIFGPIPGDWAVRGLDPVPRRLLWISLAAWLVSGLAMLPLNAWLSDHGAPIIEFEFAREDAARYLDQWGDGTWRATVSLPRLPVPARVRRGISAPPAART